MRRQRRGTKTIADTLTYRCGDVPGATGKLREAKEPAPITVCLVELALA